MKTLKIKNERKKRLWTLEYVGTQIGVTKQAVHDIENGKNYPSYEVLCKLENLFNKSHHYLFSVNNQLATDIQDDSTRTNSFLKGAVK